MKNMKKQHFKRIKRLSKYPARVILGPFGKHYAKLVAVDHKQKQHFVQWLSATDAEWIINEYET